MKPLNILAIHKSPEHNCYVFPKQQNFFGFARRLLEALVFQEYEFETFGGIFDNKTGEYTIKEDSIKKYTDDRTTFNHPDYFIEFLFGKDKVFLSIHTKKDTQQELSKLIFKCIKQR
ncbi:MAG TPA: hypothetical protein VJJ21_04680 [Candidatus Nanoarchaeia archaeon]|nr:hypothetical protein [Candidatus Nanoarchaeia archaeon]